MLTYAQSFEKQGASKVDEANSMGIWACAQLLCVLDLTAPEAAPIVRMLEEMPSTLRFMLVRDAPFRSERSSLCSFPIVFSV